MSEVTYTEAEIEKIKDRILEALEMVIDPELGIDIVNLGLIYDIRFEQDGSTEIDMTLTTIGCPLADLLTDQIHDAMKEVGLDTSLVCRKNEPLCPYRSRYSLGERL